MNHSKEYYIPLDKVKQERRSEMLMRRMGADEKEFF